MKAVTVLSLLVTFAGLGSAEAFQVSPMHVVLDAKARPTGVLTLTAGKQALRVRVSVFDWKQSRGADELSPSSSLTVFPRIMEIPSGKAGTIRVGARHPRGEVEQTWRIVIDEIPPADTSSVSGVKFVMQLSIPVFLPPAGKVEVAPRISGLSLVDGKLAFGVESMGNSTVRPARLEVIGWAGGERVFAKQPRRWYVLPGNVSPFELDLPIDECSKAEELSIELDDRSGVTLDTRLKVGPNCNSATRAK